MKTRQERLKAAMAEAGLRQKDIADHIGIKPGSVSELCTGKSQSSKHLPKIAKLLGVRALWLDTGQGPRYESEGELDQSESELLAFYRKFSPQYRPVILAQMQAFLDAMKKG